MLITSAILRSTVCYIYTYAATSPCIFGVLQGFIVFPGLSTVLWDRKHRQRYSSAVHKIQSRRRLTLAQGLAEDTAPGTRGSSY